MTSQKTCFLVGAGIRGRAYVGNAAKADPDFKPIAVAEPDQTRRAAFAKEYGIADNRCYSGWEECVKDGRIADCVINATLDDMHRDSSLPLLELGYDMLLEKPIAQSKNDMLDIVKAAEKSGATVMICHVLRYSPFYSAVKDIIESGRLGTIKHIRMSENVSWHHFTTAFVRGRFGNTQTAAPFILAKSCHDTDLMAWLMSGNPPVSVSAFGSLTHYTADNAPEGATDNCYDGCPYLESCIYSAENIFIKGRIWRFRALGDFTGTDAEARKTLTSSPFGRCVFKCDNDVTDQMAVSVLFADGATGTLSSHGFATRPSRDIIIHGTAGELVGDMEEAKLTLRLAAGPGGNYETEIIETNSAGGHELDGHGGGDYLLMEDFVKVIRGEGSNRTRIEDSVNGHLIGYAAEASRQNGKQIDLKEFGRSK